MNNPIRRRRPRKGGQEPNRMVRVAVVGPWVSEDIRQPPSGVANYIYNLLSSGTLKCDVTIIAQRGCKAGEPAPHLTVAEVWGPNRHATLSILRTLARDRPNVLHLHHEFRLFGSISGSALVYLGAALFRRRTNIVVTVHGVVSKHNVSGTLLGRKNSRTTQYIGSLAFVATYKYLGWLADDIIVLHDAFQEVMAADYGLESTVIPIGIPSTATSGVSRDDATVMMFGFLTAYKYPELVLELAEANCIPNARYLISVARNPRDHGTAYDSRYQAIERRARALGDHAQWFPYLDEQTLAELLERATVLVLPYTSLVAATAVGAQAVGSGTAVCYSTALEPIFGSGPAMFEMNLSSLTSAVIAALSDRCTLTLRPPNWIDTLRDTERVWQKVS